jgi:UDP:flavonoid glycosyltransferase YjiC (YdhE family)
MRVIGVTWAWPSHLMPMVPLALACRDSGHDVLVATQPALCGMVARAGLPGAAVGHDEDAAAVFRDIALGRAPAAPPGRRPAGGPRVLRLLVSLADSMAEELAGLAVRWRADLIVFEPTALAGPLAAAAARIPAVRHLYGTDLMNGMRRFLPAALGPLQERMGVAEADPMGVATIDPCPAGIQPEVGSGRLPVRYVPSPVPGLVPHRLPARDGRPRVCVTWGTTLSRLDHCLFAAGPVTRAVAELDVDVVVAVTADQRALLGPLPSGVRVVESAPLHSLLPDCDLVVAHGGAGTLLTALTHGLPQLHVPLLPDHRRHAAGLAEAGAGAVLPAPADPAEVRRVVTELLAAPAYRRAARRLREEMLGLPRTAELVPELELLAARVAS